MKNFIEIVDKTDSVFLININNIAFVKVNLMAICTLVMNDGTEIKTEFTKDELSKKLN